MFDFFEIVSKLKKNLARKDLFLILILLSAFFLTRLVNLDKFPIFSDEGIYIHWAKVAWHDAGWRFISLTDGKQPLQTWGTIPFLKVFPDNALLAGRLFSVSTGFMALTGVFILLLSLFGKRAAFIGSLVYIFTPYFLFYDRMALVDSAVNAGFIWILFFSLLLVKSLRLDVALIFGLVAGLSLLAKSSVRLFVILSALAPILVWEKSTKKNFRKAFNYYLLFIISAFLSLVIYNVQRLSPFFHYVAQKNKTFVMTFEEFIKAPFSVFFHNLQIIPYYVLSEMGWVVGVMGLIGFVSLIKMDKKLGRYLLFWLFLPYLALAFFSKVIFPRYLIFLGTLLVIFASYYLENIYRSGRIKFFYAWLIIVFASFAFFDLMIFFSPKNLPFPEIDKGQYIEGVTAAWGAKEIIEFARSKSWEKPVIILAEGNFGLVADVLDVFLKKNDKIFIKGYWPLDEKQLLENQEELKKNNVFVVFSHRTEIPGSWPVKIIKKYPKPGNKSALILAELIR